MRYLSTILLGLTFSVAAHADATGTWKGYGEWAFQGSGVPCEMTMRYDESEAELKRLGGFFECGIVALHSDPLTWAKKDGALFLGEDAAGAISENGFASREDYGDGVHIETKFVRDGLKAAYEERWINEKNVEIYNISGNLKLEGGREED
ncbi:MAG: hypothetical protein EOP11_08170 [Proteobacteria bacterium]|nr:MAG: hypothetical protein EOP11_08170 [Pseudomonadota bacterium]